MPDPITRLNAALEGRYRIQRLLGEGGMATVHLADDLRHQRKVALKVLKPELAAVVGAERFLTEIKTTANLQHPHILPLFDSGEADSFLFYVMPYVGGESLRDRLDREHQLPVHEVLLIAKDVAEALQAAHEQGVIHRDVKPANILMSNGRPLVSDFGIALALGAAGEGRLTETGLSLGTPHYMSPEQATGDLSVGAATDIYALGCVLYEMLVGEPPFTGSTPQAVLGKIVAGDAPSASAQRRSVPPNVDATIRRALEKVPADRFTSAQELALALADPSFRHRESASAAADHQRPFWRTAALLAVALGVGAGATTLIDGGPPDSAPADVMRFTIRPSGDAPISLSGLRHDLAISRDGRFIAYRTRTGPSGYILNVRPIDQLEGAPLRGTEGAAAPFFSPDGEWIGFVSTSGGVLSLRKVAVSGGSPVTLAEPRSMVGLSWGLDDRIVFGSGAGGLLSVPGGGGEPEPLTTLDAEQGETDHVGPHVVDGHDVILFVLNHGRAAINGGELGALDVRSGEIVRLGLNGVSPRYTSTGHLVYVAQDETVRAVPFDIDRLAVTGSPVSMLADVNVKTFTGQANLDVSLNGRLVYLSEARSALTSLMLVARDGSRSVLAELEGFGWHPRFSEDGSRVAYAVNAVSATGQSDLWVLDFARGARTRVTSGGENRFYPIWSPDGTRLTHADGTQVGNRFLLAAADGSGGPQALLDLDGQVGYPTSWSPDGRTLAYYVGSTGTPTNSRDLWMLPVNGGEPTDPYAYVEGPSHERGAIFSPDGRWVAYVSDRSGRDDVYARPFPNGPGAEITLSVGGGSEPVWSPGGTELYYRTETDLMAVSVDTGSPTLSVGPPRRIMADPFLRFTAGSMANYDITPDGESFVMVAEVGSTEVRPDVHVVLNWFEELRARVPSN